jgi:hypothetical protein
MGTVSTKNTKADGKPHAATQEINLLYRHRTTLDKSVMYLMIMVLKHDYHQN